MITNIQAKAAPPPVTTLQKSSAGAESSSSTRPAVVAPPPIRKAEIRINPEEIKKNLDQAIRQLNETMRDGGRNLAFSMDEVLGRPVVLVKKQDTGELIRQIPNEAVVKVAHNMEKLKGLLFSTHA